MANPQEEECLEVPLPRNLFSLEDWPLRHLYHTLGTFFEGEPITIARPKNRGGNVAFNSDLPVLGTLCGPIQLFVRNGRQVTVHPGETRQMEETAEEER